MKTTIDIYLARMYLAIGIFGLIIGLVYLCLAYLHDNIFQMGAALFITILGAALFIISAVFDMREKILDEVDEMLTGVVKDIKEGERK